MRARLVRDYRLVKDGDKFHIVSGGMLCGSKLSCVHDTWHKERMGEIDERHPLKQKGHLIT